MKKLLNFSVAVMGLIFTAIPTRAQTILNLDFGTSTSPVQSSFQGDSSSSDSFAPVTAGFSTSSISVNVANLGLKLDRGVAANNGSTALTGTYAAIYEDWFGTAISGISLGGLNDSTLYTITFQDYDNNSGATVNTATVTDTTPGGLGTAAIASYNTHLDPSSSLGATAGETPATLTFLSSDSGTASFSFSSPDTGARINGFELSADAIPEPSTYALLVVAGAGLFLQSKRKGVI